MSRLRSASVFALLTAFASLAVACSSKDPGPKVTADTGSDPGDTGSVTDTGSIPEDVAPLEYPAEPWGVDKAGQIFPRLTFDGYKDAKGAWTNIDMRDYYDPDGKKGIYGVLVVVGAEWCVPCQHEADQLSQFWPEQYKDHGGRFLTAIIQNKAGQPATKKTVDNWIRDHKINFDIALDDTSSALPKKSVGIPRSYIVNPRTMKIVRINSGYDSAATTNDSLNALIEKNGGKLAVVDAGPDDTGDVPTDDTGVTPDDSAIDDTGIDDTGVMSDDTSPVEAGSTEAGVVDATSIGG